MEADPIIPAVLPANAKHFAGSSHHLRHDEEEEFPNDEGVKDVIDGGALQSSQRTSSITKSRDSERRLSGTSQGSNTSKKGSGSLTASVGDETPVGLSLLASEHKGSPNGGEDLQYIDIKHFQKSPKPSQSRFDSNKKPLDYSLPENTIRNRTLEDERKQFELEKEAFEKSTRAHTASMLDVDETIDTTQSSEQKFLSLEDVKGIFQDVKGSGILNCVGDEALDNVNDGDKIKSNGGVYEDSALLGRITSGIRDSLQILSPQSAPGKSDEIPMEIAIPTLESGEPATTIENQISSLDRMEEDGHDHKPVSTNMPSLLLAPQDEEEEEDLLAKLKPAPTPERSTPQGMQMSPLERKVSKVILQQMQDEELRLEQERSNLKALRNSTKAPENVIEGISYLRNKEKVREKIEQEEAKRAKKEQEAAAEKKKDLVVADEYGDPDLVVEENDSEGPFGTLRKVLTHIYNPSGGDNEITLEEYEEKVREDELPPPPPSPQDQDVVHEKLKKKKKFGFFKSKSQKKKVSSPTAADTKTKKKSFFSKFKKSTKQKDEQIHDA